MVSLLQYSYVLVATLLRLISLDALALALLDDVKFLAFLALLDDELSFQERLNFKAINQFHFLVGFKIPKQIHLVQVTQVQVSAANRVLRYNVLKHICC